MKHLALIVAVSSCLTSMAWAQESSSGTAITNRYRYRIQETLDEVRDLQPACPTCGLYASGDDANSMSPSCRQTYQKIYKIKDQIGKETAGDQVIDVSLAFGYMDFAGSTEDRYAAIGFETQMMTPCRAGEFACGFYQNPDDADSLYKPINIMGPDGKMRTRTLSLHVRSSSVTDNERVNRTTRADEQKALSAATQKFFLDSLQTSDIAFYVGHARDGGGPDFSPPVLTKDKRQVPDYAWYHAHEPGVYAMQNALQGAQHPVKILGIFACYADDHFTAWLKDLLPNSGVILSGQQEFEASVAQATASLDSIMGLRCSQQFNQSVDILKNVNDVVITPVRIERVFKGD